MRHTYNCTKPQIIIGVSVTNCIIWGYLFSRAAPLKNQYIQQLNLTFKLDLISLTGLNGCMKAFLGIDQGSGSTKALLISSLAEELFGTALPVSINFISGGAARQDAQEILESVQTVLQQTREYAAKNKIDILSCGLSTQRSGVLAWDADTGKPLSKVYNWQDLSTEDFILPLREKYQDEIFKMTGLPVSAHYAAGKIHSLQQEFTEPNVRIGTLDTYLVNILSDKRLFVTDSSAASRTMLYSLTEKNWSKKLCGIFKVDIKRLPLVKPTLYNYGSLNGINLTALCADQQAATLGVNNANTPLPTLILGTVGSLIVPLDTPVFSKGYMTNVLYSKGSEENPDTFFQIEGTVNCCGATIDLIRERVDKDFNFETFPCTLPEDSPDSYPLAFLPLGGTASPDWRSDLPCVLSNWNKKYDEKFIRAALDNLACFISLQVDNLKKIVPQAFSSGTITATGGISRSDYILQFVADVSECVIRRAGSTQGSALGAARLAARSLSANAPQTTKTFTPASHSIASRRWSLWNTLRQEVLSGTTRHGLKVLRLKLN
ncbi:MAG: hypothetical protein D6719_07415 [Candidatus Dadabacteria bacterium]|nr:MAG: hypothetical protein D6719_07415 [Candidatus Dadabacteria bacterium]